MFTVEKNQSGLYYIFYDGNLAAIVPIKESVEKAIGVIRKRICGA